MNRHTPCRHTTWQLGSLVRIINSNVLIAKGQLCNGMEEQHRQVSSIDTILPGGHPFQIVEQ